ncbi:N-(5'-phosphoribosyl)anthranilate isomerase [Maritimibacter dapengensis]|nr:N-(5'-phosphoribosyl)anthranilate isomerase [Maritimibacter dapengensis]
MEPIFAHRPASASAPLPVPVTSPGPRDPAPDIWMDQAFTCPTALKGGVIKRSIEDVDRIVGRDLFLSEVRRRGFQAVENGLTLVIFCNGDPVRLAAARGPLILR